MLSMLYSPCCDLSDMTGLRKFVDVEAVGLNVFDISEEREGVTWTPLDSNQPRFTLLLSITDSDVAEELELEVAE